MALIAWLPFVKDSRQQGLSSDVSVTGTISLDNSGKLGKCLNSSNEVAINTNHSFSKIWSFCFWGYVNGSSVTSNWTQIARINDGSSNLRIEVCPASYNNGIFCYSTHNNTGYAITNGSIASPSGGYYNQWAHFCLTSDGTTITKYMNGVSIGTCAYNGSGTITGTFVLSNNHIIKKNDARIYDHCLSPMEVKELAKGLVLHYPLNRGGWGQENLLRGSNVIGSGTTIYGWISNGSATGMEILLDGSLHYKYNISNTKYIPSITTNTVVPCEFGKTYFYSMDLKFDKSITLGAMVPAHFWVGARNSDSITNTSCNGNLSGIQIQYINNHSGTLAANTWVHITTKFTFPAAATSSGYNYPAIRCFVYGSVLTETTTGEVNVWMKNCKVEEGSIETPWCPHVEDALATTMGLNGTTEYDCSGFCNNGTRIGTFAFNSDTPKYFVSTEYNGTDNTLVIPFDANIWQTNFTMSIWFKKDAIGSKGYETLFGGPSGFEMDTRAGTATTLSLYMASIRGGTLYTGFEFGKWYMVTLVNNGINELYYVNGELVKTIEKKAMPVGTYYIGSWNGVGGQNYQGLISDARIYATALSADDVKSLYQNSAYIDSSGNVYGAVHSEV